MARSRAARTASSDASTPPRGMTTRLLCGAILVALLALFVARHGSGAPADARARGPSLASLDAPPPLSLIHI